MTRNLLRVFTLSLAFVLSLSAYAAGEIKFDGDTGKVTLQVAKASAAATPKRHTAMRFNYAQRGDWYLYGGNGPSRWDCSGLVVASYKKVGITLPRTTGDMLRDRKDQLARTYSPRWGDLVFTSSGHVEMYVKKGVMHGAHKSGTRVGYKNIYKGASGYPKYYRVRGAG